ncbi:MAG TPA: double-strand break repair protein AddB [Rickettsiales bacterium]|nr:double-strand break repair protein AddB [Rickettsiales bacterium]
MPDNIYNIPANFPFSDTLAHFVLQTYGADPLQLSKILILLPSRRACGALRDAFLRASGGKPLLLPRMQPLGDVNEDTLLVTGETPLTLRRTEDFVFRRLFILADLITKKNGARIDHALRLAVELATLLDELERERLPIGDLSKLAPEDFAQHWQLTVDFLKIISEYWPLIAQEENIVSDAAYLNSMLEEICALWRKAPPSHPVIVAGTTGSVPATAELIRTVASLPQGMVVLPGLDTQAGGEYLEHIDESHAQWGMCRLLEKLECALEDVRTIAAPPELGQGSEARLKLLSEVMRPAEVSEIWQHLELDVQAALPGLKSITCADAQEEAVAIALLLRETLEHPGKTAALVTHDRSLARRVCAIMKRFGVEIDDSAGVPLLQTPTGSFLRLVIEAAESNLAAIELISLLKHPLTHAGLERIACLEAAREFELAILRNPHLALKGSWKAVMQGLRNEGITYFIQTIEQAFAPFIALLETAQQETCTLQELIAAHIQCAETLAGEALWQGPESQSVSDLMAQLQQVGQGRIVQDAGTTYLEMMDVCFAGKVYRPSYGGHPRLKILGPIEARMQLFDRMILGGLNEGSWPQEAGGDPWLNRPMRAKVGLPAPERAIGLAAHDFVMLANAPEVYLSRSAKVNGSPATPSRWLVKLGVLLEKFGVQDALEDRRWQRFVALLDVPQEEVRISEPEPKPPLAARPNTLSVTQVETLLRNPYAIYASKILELYPLEPIGRELNGADFGNVLHKVLEEFVRLHPQTLPPNAEAELLQLGKARFAPLFHNEKVRALWWPRFMQVAQFVLAQEHERRRAIEQVLAEVTGSRRFGEFTLTGRADRVERNRDGSLAVIDYKTGQVPSGNDIASGLSSQLVLLGLIFQSSRGYAEEPKATTPQSEGVSVSEGGDALAPLQTIQSLEYWRLQGGEAAGEVKFVEPGKIEAFMKAAEEGLAQLIEKYSDPQFPYRCIPVPDHAPAYDDYAHLARIAEWRP